jgi:hypothetical protein
MICGLSITQPHLFARYLQDLGQDVVTNKTLFADAVSSSVVGSRHLPTSARGSALRLKAVVAMLVSEQENFAEPFPGAVARGIVPVLTHERGARHRLNTGRIANVFSDPPVGIGKPQSA